MKIKPLKMSMMRNIMYMLAITIYETTSLLKLGCFNEDQSNFIYAKTYYLNLVAYSLLIVCVITAQYTKKELQIILIISILMGIVWHLVGVDIVLSSILIIFAAKDIDAYKLLKCLFITQLVITVSIITASQFGLIRDYVISERQRHCLGFSWALIPAALLWVSAAEYLCLRDKKITLVELLIIAAIGIWMYKMTDSRTAFYLLILLLLLVAVKKYLIKDELLNRVQIKWLAMLPLVIASLSIMLHAAYSPNNKVFSSLNGMLSGRLQLGKSAIDNYGIKFFGNVITWVGESVTGNNSGLAYNYVDCSYLQILLTYGIITLVMFLVAYTLIMRKAIINQQYILVIVLVCVMMYGIVEDILIFITRCPFIILLFTEQQKLKNG